jgi:hypothetical protein
MKKAIRYLLTFIFLISAFYGLSRLYFRLTDGFRLANITSAFPYQKEWEVHALDEQEQLVVSQVFNQPYFYLGKGCQAYAFLSQDGQYVIKFFKYQRYRLQSWLEYSPPLPALVQYKQEKLAKKWNKLDGFVKSWKIAFDYLKDETGLLFVHLNKTTHLNQSLVIFDKLGLKHTVALDQMEFCVQRCATMLCEVLMDYKQKEELPKAKQLIDRLLQLVLSEYKRGLADNDHALMQNTGVVDGHPIHIDVGQFVVHETVKEPAFYHQELFTKTYKFKIWLADHYPELKLYLDQELEKIMGPAYLNMQPKFRQK